MEERIEGNKEVEVLLSSGSMCPTCINGDREICHGWINASSNFYT